MSIILTDPPPWPPPPTLDELGAQVYENYYKRLLEDFKNRPRLVWPDPPAPVRWWQFWRWL